MELTKTWFRFDNDKLCYLNTIALVSKSYHGFSEQQSNWFKRIAETEHFKIYNLTDDAKEEAENLAKEQFGKHFIAMVTFHSYNEEEPK
jgi:hypothetical protein